MTLIRPIETELASVDALGQTSDLLERHANTMAELMKRVEAGETPPETELKKTVTALTSLSTIVMKERDRVLEQRKRASGIVGDYAIDFAAARSEIECKLDLLRDA